jgi:hypothetical protein
MNQIQFTALLIILYSSVVHGPEPDWKTPYVDRCASFLSLQAPRKYQQHLDAIDSEVEIHHIEINEKIRVRSPEQCATEALYTCLGIAVINVKKKTAYLIHHSGGPGSKDYKYFLEEILEQKNNPDDLRVALVGNVLWDPKELGPNDRDFPNQVIRYLEERGIKSSNIATALGNRGVARGEYSVRVDPKNGQIYATFEPF